MPQSTLIQNATIVGSTHKEPVDVFVENGVIQNIDPDSRFPIPDPRTIDATNMLLFPGFIDCHVHFREPGYEHKATLVSEAKAAKTGGVTTVCEMPNTNPPTVTVAALADKVRRATDIGIDARFFFGVTKEPHLATLKEIWTGESEELQRLKARCCGVKLYLDHSTGNQKVEGGIIDEVFHTCAELNISLVAHSEDPDLNEQAATKCDPSGDISLHSRMRPPESEAASIAFAIDKVRRHSEAFHVAHISTAAGIELVRKAKNEGLPITCEACPHHLLLNTDDYTELGTLGKMNPPLRSQDDCNALWAGIADGTIDCIATDHAPHTLSEKRCEPPLSAPSGVPGVETMIPLLLTIAAKQPAILSYDDILRLCFTNPNRIYSLGKKPIKEGSNCDIVIVDPNKEWTISNKNQHTKCGWTPYDGWEITGAIENVLPY